MRCVIRRNVVIVVCTTFVGSSAGVSLCAIPTSQGWFLSFLYPLGVALADCRGYASQKKRHVQGINMVYDTYSKRTDSAKWLQIEQYNKVPKPLCNQIVRILGRTIEFAGWKSLWLAFCEERGEPEDEEIVHHGYDEEWSEDQKNHQSLCYKKIRGGVMEDVFDLVDIAFQMTCHKIQDGQNHGIDWQEQEEAYEGSVEELNIRFKEARVGYRLVNNRIERNIISLDMALPAMDLLRGEDFKDTMSDFSLAHKHYQNKDYKDCTLSANRSFESLLKTLCKQQNLEFNSNGQIGDLVKILCNHLFSNNKFNEKMSQTFKALPTVRAHYGGHGLAEEIDYMARYALHLAATNILFFMQAVEARNKSTKTEENSSGIDDDIPF